MCRVVVFFWVRIVVWRVLSCLLMLFVWIFFRYSGVILVNGLVSLVNLLNRCFEISCVIFRGSFLLFWNCLVIWV